MCNQKIWFKRWITEGYSVRQLSKQSGLSLKKMKEIKSYWMSQEPPTLTTSFETARYLIFDATYFNHERCVMVIRDSESRKVISTQYAVREDYAHTIDWFRYLQRQGLTPYSVTMDGQLKVIRAMTEVWSACIIQRCTYHIQQQGESWLRRYPKTQLARDLKSIIHKLSSIDTEHDRDIWHELFLSWRAFYSQQLQLLNPKDAIEGDTIHAYRVIENAYPNMFHYLTEKRVPRTSNALEGYFSHLKRLYRNHAGLRKIHLNQYLSWYIFFKNMS
ncbi:MAG: transposase [Candidatus Roizmanbacteria bacterium]